MPADRRDLARLAAPVAFLVAITILIVLVHSALSSGGETTTAAATTAKHTTTKAKPKQKPRRSRTTTAGATTATTATSTGPAQYYTIQSGDTFAAIAAREGTTVDELLTLNPGVNPNALTVGRQIRIK